MLLMSVSPRRFSRGGGAAEIELLVAGNRQRFVVDSLSDLHVLVEVLIRRLYDVPQLEMANTIVDLGAHIGASVAFFKSQRPTALIHAFEPDPRNFWKLERNVGHLPGVFLYREAVSDQRGTAVLYASSQSWSSSLVHLPPDGRPVTVPTRTLGEICQAAGAGGVDLLKLDIEGAEYSVLRTPGALHRVQALVGEVHPRFLPSASLEGFRELLDGYDVRFYGDETTTGHVEFSAVRRQR